MNKRVLENKILRALVLLVVSTSFYGVSYAYWNGQIEGNGSAVTDVVTTEELTLDFTNTNEINVAQATPGKKISKTFTIDNTSDYSISYDIIWETFANTFDDKTDIVYDLEGSNNYFYSKIMPVTGNNIVISDNIRIEANESHTYTLTIRFLNKRENQNDNNDKLIRGRIVVETNKTNEGYGLTSEIIRNNTPTSYLTKPGSAISSTDEGLISGEEDNDGNTLYFRGNVNDNYVSFANKLWRIIRINGDGSVRMIMNESLSNSKAWNTNKDSSYNNTYQTSSYEKMISWMTYSNTAIKTELDTWYQNNIDNNENLKSKLVKAEYCSDITTSGNTNDMGIGTYLRSSKPSFKCPSDNVYNSRIGLINADEVIFAGGKYGSNNLNYYLYDNYWYWTMSPAYWTNNNYVTSYYVSNSGNLDNRNVNSVGALRPVINVDGSSLVSTSSTNPGTSSNPYVVVGTTSLVLGEPGKLRFSNITTSALTVRWPGADNATYYKIERKLDDGEFQTLNNNVSSNVYNDSSLSPNRTYTYRVTACNASECNDTKSIGQVTTAATIGAVASFNSSNITLSTVDLTWSAATNADYYKLERKTGRESYYFVDTQITALTITDEILNNGTTYTYRIRGCIRNEDSVEYCGETNTLTVTSQVYITSNTIPTLTAVTPTTATLSWTAGTNATYYKVARKVSGDANYTTLSNNHASLNYSDSGLSANTTYIYQVTACTSRNNTEFCADPTYLTVLTSPAIGAMSTLSYSNLDIETLTVNWSSVTNATYYKVSRKLSSASSYTTLNSNYTSLSYDDTGLSENTSYDYKVVPCAKSSTNTEYCGSQGTLTVTTESSAVTLVDTIIGKSPTSTGSINSDGLMKVSQAATGLTPAQTEYRYSGTSVKNYITFNSETWRIIGVFSVDDGNGTYVNRVRIIKDSSYTNAKWHSTSSNTWSSSSIASTLTGTYYNALATAAKGQIGSAKWYVRPTGYSNSASAQYTAERTSGTGNNTTWTGTIALMYPSDYGYASSSCYSGTTTLYNYDGTTCKNSNWLFKNNSTNYWTITPYSSNTSNALRIATSAYLTYSGVTTSYAILPVTHLKSTVIYTSGTGTSSDPYIIT